MPLLPNVHVTCPCSQAFAPSQNDYRWHQTFIEALWEKSSQQPYKQSSQLGVQQV